MPLKHEIYDFPIVSGKLICIFDSMDVGTGFQRLNSVAENEKRFYK